VRKRCLYLPVVELVPVVDTVLPMSELMRAHEMVDERTHFGKVILVNDE
jgi:NADPH:quinone reductase-like Zn-dependent oxidoreductase